MATEQINADALVMVHTGAASAGGVQSDPAACLGGHRAATVTGEYGALIDLDTPYQRLGTVRIERLICKTAPTGQLTITAESTGSLSFNGGAAVSIVDSQTRLLEGADTSWGVVVTRDGSADLVGRLIFTPVPVFNNALGLGNVPNADRVAGETYYRAVGLYNFRAFSVAITGLNAVGSDPTVHVAFETPGADGTIQTIANEKTAPTGLSWYTTIPSGDLPVTLGTGEWVGVWIRRTVAADVDVNVQASNLFTLSHYTDLASYTRVCRGDYRIEDTTLEGYELYVGEDDDPDFESAPAETSATLPFSHTITPPVSGETEFRSVVRYRNAYDLVSPNIYARSRVVDENGDEVVQGPTAPTFSVATGPGGIVKISMSYDPGEDDDEADTWRIYIEEGEDPVPGVDTPVEVAMSSVVSVIGSTSRSLTYDSPQFGHGVDVHVLVTAYRSDDSAESENTTAVSVTTDTRQPTVPLLRAWHIGNVARQEYGPPTVDDTTVYDSDLNVYGHGARGKTDLYVDTTLVWRLVYDSQNSAGTNGLWTIYSMHNENISGTAASMPVDVVSATELYVGVADVRRLKIDLTAGVISCAAFSQNPSRLVTDYGVDLFSEREWHTLLQVWDVSTWQYVTVGSLDRTGRLTLLIPIRQRDTVEEFP